MSININSKQMKLNSAGKKFLTALLLTGAGVSIGVTINQNQPLVNANAVSKKSVVGTTDGNIKLLSYQMPTVNKELRSNLGIPGASLPSSDGVDPNMNAYLYGQVLSESSANNTKNYKVQYSLKSKGSSTATPYATFEKKSFGDAKAANNYTKTINSSDQSGTSVDLGNGITGKAIGTAGTTYTHWAQQGYWVQTSQEQSAPNGGYTDIAKGTAGLLNGTKLPQLAKGENGAVNFDSQAAAQSGKLGQKIVVQDGSNVFTLQAHDPVTATKMASSIDPSI